MSMNSRHVWVTERQEIDGWAINSHSAHPRLVTKKHSRAIILELFITRGANIQNSGTDTLYRVLQLYHQHFIPSVTVISSTLYTECYSYIINTLYRVLQLYHQHFKPSITVLSSTCYTECYSYIIKTLYRVLQLYHQHFIPSVTVISSTLYTEC